MLEKINALEHIFESKFNCKKVFDSDGMMTSQGHVAKFNLCLLLNDLAELNIVPKADYYQMLNSILDSKI